MGTPPPDYAARRLPSPHPEVQSSAADRYVGLGREGMVTVWDDEGGYLGCMGVETWQRLLWTMDPVSPAVSLDVSGAPRHFRQSENEWVYALSDALERLEIDHVISVRHRGSAVPPSLAIDAVEQVLSVRKLANALIEVGADAYHSAGSGWTFKRASDD